MIQMTGQQLREIKRKAKFDGVMATLILMTLYGLFIGSTVYMFMK